MRQYSLLGRQLSTVKAGNYNANQDPSLWSLVSVENHSGQFREVE